MLIRSPLITTDIFEKVVIKNYSDHSGVDDTFQKPIY